MYQFLKSVLDAPPSTSSSLRIFSYNPQARFALACVSSARDAILLLLRLLNVPSYQGIRFCFGPESMAAAETLLAAECLELAGPFPLDETQGVLNRADVTTRQCFVSVTDSLQFTGHLRLSEPPIFAFGREELSIHSRSAFSIEFSEKQSQQKFFVQFATAEQTEKWSALFCEALVPSPVAVASAHDCKDDADKALHALVPTFSCCMCNQTLGLSRLYRTEFSDDSAASCRACLRQMASALIEVPTEQSLASLTSKFSPMDLSDILDRATFDRYLDLAFQQLINRDDRAFIHCPTCKTPIEVVGGAPPKDAAVAGALPEHWSARVDKRTNRIYYANAHTRTTQWTRPIANNSAPAFDASPAPELSHPEELFPAQV